MGEVGRHRLVHPRLAVAVGADQVVPPLMTGFVGDEVLDVALADVRHAEDALVDHDQGAALVAVPAEIRFDDGEIGLRDRGRSAAVVRDDLGDRLEHEAGVMFVFGEGEAVQAHRRQAGQRRGLGGEFDEAGAAQEGEVAHAVGGDVHLLLTVGRSCRPVMVPLQATFCRPAGRRGRCRGRPR